MENHHFQWVNQLFLWPFSMSLFVCLPGRVRIGLRPQNFVVHPGKSTEIQGFLPHGSTDGSQHGLNWFESLISSF